MPLWRSTSSKPLEMNLSLGHKSQETWTSRMLITFTTTPVFCFTTNCSPPNSHVWRRYKLYWMKRHTRNCRHYENIKWPKWLSKVEAIFNMCLGSLMDCWSPNRTTHWQGGILLMQVAGGETFSRAASVLIIKGGLGCWCCFVLFWRDYLHFLIRRPTCHRGK